jgi:hypothetical protein
MISILINIININSLLFMFIKFYSLTYLLFSIVQIIKYNDAQNNIEKIKKKEF